MSRLAALVLCACISLCHIALAMQEPPSEPVRSHMERGSAEDRNQEHSSEDTSDIHTHGTAQITPEVMSALADASLFDVVNFWEGELFFWDTHISLLSYLRKSNLFHSLLDLVDPKQLSHAELSALVEDLHRSETQIDDIRTALAKAFGNIPPEHLRIALWHIVAEEDMKQNVLGMNPAAVELKNTPMNDNAMVALIQTMLAQAEQQQASEGSDENNKGTPVNGITAASDGYYDGMPDSGEPQQFSTPDTGGSSNGSSIGEGAAVGTVSTSSSGAQKSPAMNAASPGTKPSPVSQRLQCRVGHMGGKSSAGFAGPGGGDVTPPSHNSLGTTGPDGGFGGSGVDTWGMPTGNQQLWQAAANDGIGYASSPCYGLDPSKIYSSTGSGVGTVPQHLRHSSYSWKTKVTSWESGAGGQLYKITQETSFEPDPGYDNSGDGDGDGGLKLGYDPDMNQGKGGAVVYKVKGTMTTKTTKQKAKEGSGKTYGKKTKTKTTEKVEASPQENEENYENSKEAGDAGSKVKSDKPPSNDTGTPGGQSYDPNATDSGICASGNSHGAAGCNIAANSNDPAWQECTKVLQEQYGQISMVDPAAIGAACGDSSQALGLLLIHQLWDPIDFIKQHGTNQKMGHAIQPHVMQQQMLDLQMNMQNGRSYDP